MWVPEYRKLEAGSHAPAPKLSKTNTDHNPGRAPEVAFRAGRVRCLYSENDINYSRGSDLPHCSSVVAGETMRPGTKFAAFCVCLLALSISCEVCERSTIGQLPLDEKHAERLMTNSSNPLQGTRTRTRWFVLFYSAEQGLQRCIEQLRCAGSQAGGAARHAASSAHEWDATPFEGMQWDTTICSGMQRHSAIPISVG